MSRHEIVTLSSEDSIRLTPSGLHSGMDITIQNVHDSAYVYIGGEGVTSSDYGYRLIPNAAISFELPGRDALYAVSDTDESQVAVLKTNLETGN